MVDQLWAELFTVVSSAVTAAHQKQLWEELQNIWGLIQAQQSKILSLRSLLNSEANQVILTIQNHPDLPDPD